MLLLRALIEGQYWEALTYSPPVLGVTAACCLVAIRWAIGQFNNESVLFRESERWDLGIWLRHLVRDREDLPTVGEAILCGVLVLVLHFLASFFVPPDQSWPRFVTTTLIMQIALIATPACLMAIMLTRRPWETLKLGRPSFLVTIPAAGLLAALLHPSYLWLSEQIGRLYPMSPGMVDQLKPLFDNMAGQPLWQVLLLIALTPAICEEMAFRGFILSGLRRMGHKWGAIALASLFFGLTHGVLQQSLGAFLVGMVIGYIAVKTGSLWPGVLYHLVSNGLSVLLTRVTPETLEAAPPLRLILKLSPGVDGQVTYQLPATIVAAVLAAGLVWWFKSLPYHRLAEERLQEALDHQTANAAARSAA
jgi:sodium transport system permease protein